MLNENRSGAYCIRNLGSGSNEVKFAMVESTSVRNPECLPSPTGELPLELLI